MRSRRARRVAAAPSPRCRAGCRPRSCRDRRRRAPARHWATPGAGPSPCRRDSCRGCGHRGGVGHVSVGGLRVGTLVHRRGGLAAPQVKAGVLAGSHVDDRPREVLIAKPARDGRGVGEAVAQVQVARLGRTRCSLQKQRHGTHELVQRAADKGPSARFALSRGKALSPAWTFEALWRDRWLRAGALARPARDREPLPASPRLRFHACSQRLPAALPANPHPPSTLDSMPPTARG